MSGNMINYAELQYYLVTKVTVKKCDECTGSFKSRNIHSSSKYYSENDIKY